jgi:hypothetical protein
MTQEEGGRDTSFIFLQKKKIKTKLDPFLINLKINKWKIKIIVFFNPDVHSDSDLTKPIFFATGPGWYQDVEEPELSEDQSDRDRD